MANSPTTERKPCERSATASGLARSGNRRLAAVLLGLSFLSVRARAQTTWHVDASAAPGGDGLTWATALSSLQSALDVVTPADQIWVAAGTYRPTSRADPADPRSARFWLHDPFELFGGFDGTETSLDERDPELFDDTILSGDIGIRGEPSDNAYRVVEVSSGFPPVGFALLDGFRITAAKGVGSGGGVFVRGRGLPGTYPSRVILRQCTVSDNDAFRGGALAADDFGIVYMERCLVERNTALIRGGAIWAHAGVLRIANTRFTDNKTTNLGGVLYSDAQTVQGLVRFANCVFRGNDARLGGVAYVQGGDSFAGVGAWYNCTFVENAAFQTGGVIYAVTDVPVSARVLVYNSILWNNSAAASPSIFGTGLDVRFSDVQGGYPGPGNLDVDPQLVTSDRPGAGSPVNDAGSNGLLAEDFTDLDEDGDVSEQLPLGLHDGTRRLDDPMAPDTGAGSVPIVDMGAYEMDAAHQAPPRASRGPR